MTAKTDRFLGIRCNNKECNVVVLAGTKGNPTLVHKERMRLPKDFAQSDALLWLHQELAECLTRNGPMVAVCIKGVEPKARKVPVPRIENEAAVQLAVAAAGISDCCRRVKSTLAKQLGQKGRPGYLAKVDTDAVAGAANLTEDMREALLCAWSIMHD